MMKIHYFSKLFMCGMLLAASSMSIHGAVTGSTSRPSPTSIDPPFQARPSAVTGSTSPPTRTVWPHELMTFQERHELWLKMRAARTPTERMELWTKQYAQLEKRGVKLGVTLREPEPPMMMRYEERHPRMQEERFAPGRREYGMPVESPYGYGTPRHEALHPRHEALQPRYEPFRPTPPMMGR